MSDESTRRPAQPIDRRSAIELIAGFVGAAAVFSALSIDSVQRLRSDPGYSVQTLQLGLLIGTLIGLGLTALAVRAQRRGSGRRSQRMGRQAWRTGRLPTTEADRASAVQDLRRRRRVLNQGLSPMVLIGVWALVGVFQVVGSHSVLHTATWIVLSGALVGTGVRGLLDRRRLPQLDALLSRAAENEPAGSEGTDV